MIGLLGFFAGLALGCLLAYLGDTHRRKRYGKLLSFGLHEVNTPLTSMHMTILNFIQGVFGALPKEFEPWVIILKEQSSRMADVLNDLRDLIHMEFLKDLQCHPEPVSLEAIVRNVLHQMETSMARSDIEVSLDVASTPMEILADKDQMQRIISSLVANARKFQSGGRVSVSLGPVDATPGSAASFLELTVSYRGSKVVPANAEQLLKLYYPVDRGEGSAVLPCVGLGLGFCKRLLELQGGDLSFEIDENGNARMRARMPTALVSGGAS